MKSKVTFVQSTILPRCENSRGAGSGSQLVLIIVWKRSLSPVLMEEQGLPCEGRT